MRSSVFPVLLLTLGLAACHSDNSEDPAIAREKLDRNLEPRTVSEIEPEIREERPTVALVGEVRAFDTVQISSEVAGRVEKVNVEVGDTVSKGEALFSMDRRTFELRLRQAEARVQAAKADLDLARRHGQRIVVLYAGMVVEEFPAAVAPRHPYSRFLWQGVESDPVRKGKAPVAACPYLARCPDRQATCSEGIPPLLEVAPGHRLRCPVALDQGAGH